MAVLAWLVLIAGTVAPSNVAEAAPRPRLSLSVDGAVFGKPANVRIAVSGGTARTIQVGFTASPTTYNLVGASNGEWQVPWPAAGPQSLRLTVTLRSGRVLRARRNVTVAPAKSGGFQLVFLYPAGHDLPGQAEAIAHAAHEVRYWYAQQMGGPAPMFVNDASGLPSVLRIETPVAPEQIPQSDIVGETMDDWVAAGTIPAGVVPFVFLNGRQSGNYCGVSRYEPRYVVIPMANCRIAASMTDRFPYGATYIIAHEIAHELGAMSDNAPHNDGKSHITDAPTDLLYFGPGQRDNDHLTLDPGHDDYYLTGRSDLVNIEASPLLDDK